MHRPSRPPNPPDGSTAVKATEDSGGHPQPVGASAQTSSPNQEGGFSFGNPVSTGEGAGGAGGGGGGGGGGDPESPSCCRTHAGQGVHRPKKLHFSRRSSSGYISEGDSQPSSPKLVTADKATQTTSPAGQAVAHARQRMAEGQKMHQQLQHGLSPSLQQGNGAVDMQAEAFGRELRIIGDDYNQLLMQRRTAAIQRYPGIALNLRPNIQQEPITLLCVSLVLILIGRILYLHSSTNGQDQSQV